MSITVECCLDVSRIIKMGKERMGEEKIGEKKIRNRKN